MRSWWGKSSKESKKKASKESFIDTLHRKFRNPSEGKVNTNGSSGGSRRRCIDTVSERGSQSRAESRSPSPSKQVSRCQSFAERPHTAQPLPLPLKSSDLGRTESGISKTAKSRLEKVGKSASLLPLPKPSCIRHRLEPTDLEENLTTDSVYSDGSSNIDDVAESGLRSPQATDYDNGTRTAASSLPSRLACSP